MICLTDINLFERGGTNKVLGNEKNDDKATLPAPVTRYVTSLAFAMHVRFIRVVLIKSHGLHVM